MQAVLARFVDYRPRFGSAAIDGRRLLRWISAVCECELDHPGVLADTAAAVGRRDAAKMRSMFEGYAVMVPEGNPRFHPECSIRPQSGMSHDGIADGPVMTRCQATAG